jgi:hypothetical protein
MRKLALTLLAVVALPVATAHAGDRPHTMVRLNDRDGVAVTRFEAFVRRSDGRLKVGALLAARMRSGTAPRFVELRFARCTGGEVNFPVCPVGARRRVKLVPGKTAFRGFTVTLRQPPPRLDAIRVSLATPGAPVVRPRVAANPAIADLLLRGSAWREEAGGTFGLSAPRPPAGLRLLSARVDGAGVSADHLRPTLAYRMTDDTPVENIFTPCGELPPTCKGHTWMRPTARAFLERPGADRPEGAGDYGFVVRPQGGGPALLTVRLPWPGGPANAH